MLTLKACHCHLSHEYPFPVISIVISTLGSFSFSVNFGTNWELFICFCSRVIPEKHYQTLNLMWKMVWSVNVNPFDHWFCSVQGCMVEGITIFRSARILMHDRLHFSNTPQPLLPLHPIMAQSLHNRKLLNTATHLFIQDLVLLHISMSWRMFNTTLDLHQLCRVE